MFNLSFWREKRRLFGTAVFVLGISILIIFSNIAVAGENPALAKHNLVNALSPTASLTIEKDTVPTGGIGFPFTLLSNGPALIWGEQGTGDGQFQNQSGLAFDNAGNILVADRTNHRIQKFDKNGNFLLKWGSNGSGDGQFNYPTDVAIDTSGNIYVSDQYNHRIQKFDSNGNFLYKWGSYGSGDGQFNRPAFLAFDSQGNLYITEYLGSRIQKFDSSDNFLLKWGGYGSGDGQFNHVGGIAIDGMDNIYAADLDNHRVQKFESDGDFLTKWGSYGSGDGQFYGAAAVATDTVGNVFVSDWNNHRIQKFTNSGEFLRKWGSNGTAPGQFNHPDDIIVDADGAVYVTDQDGFRIQMFVDEAFSLDDGASVTYTLNPATYLLTELVPDGWLLDSGSCDNGNSPDSITLAAEDDVTCSFMNHALPPTAALTIEKDTVPTGGIDFPFTLLSDGPALIWGEQGSGDGQLYYPGGAVVDSAGNLYVAERDNHRIQKFDGHGTPLAMWGTHGSEKGQFDFVNYVAVDSADNVYATDHFNHRIQKFDSNGTFLLAWGWDVISGNAETGFEICRPSDTCKAGTAGGGVGQFHEPSGVAVYDDGNGNVYVYVAARYNQRIQKFTGDGEYLDQWGSAGTGNGQFNEGYGVTVDSAGNVYVADRLNHRIQKFDSTGVFLTKWGSVGNGNGQFNAPRGVAVNEAGIVYVADTDNHRIQKFDSTGVFLAKWGSYGSGSGQFGAPWGIATDDSGNIFVPDLQNHRIQKFVDEAFSLDDGASVTYTLNPATYLLTELVPDGWLLDSGSCDNGNSPDSIALSGGDDVTCTFVNQCIVPSAPVIAISSYGTQVQLSWSAELANSGYNIYRSSNDPYFTPAVPPYANAANSPWLDPDTTSIGDADNNYFYIMRTVSSCSESADSKRLGEFDFSLVPGTH